MGDSRYDTPRKNGRTEPDVTSSGSCPKEDFGKIGTGLQSAR
jgi:hypothetical protein